MNGQLPLPIRFASGHLLSALLAAILASFRSRAALQLEILALRHQLGVLQRSVKRPKLTPADRFLWAWLCVVWRSWQSSVFIVKAATVIAWHRKGFRLFWAWKVRHGKPGRPAVPKEVRQLYNSHHELREPTLGSSADSRRIAQAGHRHRRDQREQVPGAPPQAALPDLADLPRQPREDEGFRGRQHSGAQPHHLRSLFIRTSPSM